jgi:DNA replication and repair protein RecF
LLLRIAQAGWYTQNIGRKPIYLLDDVLLELDGDRKHRFFSLLPKYEQAFFTFLPEEQLLSLQSNSALIYTVNEGRLSS